MAGEVWEKGSLKLARLYVPLDVNLPDDPKMARAGADAEHLYLRGLMLAKRIGGDGVIDRAHLPRLCDGFTVLATGESDPDELAQILVNVGAWLPVDGGFVIAAWLEHNPSDDEIEAKRETERQRKAAWRESKRDTRGCPDGRDAGVPTDATPRDGHESESESESESEDSFGHEFAAWWQGYRNTKDKAAAFKAFKARRRAGVSLEDLLRARDNYLTSEVLTDDQFIKRGATFLNGAEGPWSEYLDAPPKAKPQGGPVPVGPAYQEWKVGSA